MKTRTDEQQPKSEPEVLGYAPVEKPRQTNLERATKLLSIVGVVMTFVGSITLDGGDLWAVLSCLFGLPMSLCGILCTALAYASGRRIWPVGPLAVLIGVPMLIFGVLGLLSW